MWYSRFTVTLSETKGPFFMEEILDWYIKDRIIFSRPVGDISINNVQEYAGYVVNMLNKGKSPVHLIVDARFIAQAPTNLLALSKATTFMGHPSVGWVMTVTTNPVIQFLAGMVPQIGRVKYYRVFPDLDLCMKFLKEQDRTLDWTGANHALSLESKV
jgi:hypothetical protein